ncbi:MAG: proline--tRNA ligase [Butyribacter sp.]|nr:proline--tRNA ligase [bacterium]MDY3855298.1 proline--tRNA ligase [Butyribacter sp.]
MKVSKLIGSRFKERPADCVIDSHALMVRGGYMKNVGNGIFSEFPTLKRITAKIENIIRQEMDAIDGQEVLFPVVLPADLWDESGRYESVGSELLRFTDRNDSKMVLAMTHEEAAVHLVREYAQSYTKYPFMIYQIQRKFRDEARPRAGMIRVREFTMKDAYSFHTSQEDLERYYNKCYDAYNRIFARAGIPEVVTVASDSGMMGGNISHEYMLLTPVGEDSIVLCTECDYRANMEAAENKIDDNVSGELEELQCIETPDCKTIEDVCKFLKSDVTSSCKAVVYQKNADDTFVVAFVRGDYEVNETKLRNLVGEEIHPAEITEEDCLVAGYIGPYDIAKEAEFYLDVTLKGIPSLVAGANKEGYHYTGLNLERDLEKAEYVDISKIQEGSICPCCGKKAITIQRGIEVGNIFQLGTKYTESMGMQYTDENGKQQYPIMGCYGIGVGRLAASICEAHHDDFGPIWPISIAPWEVHVCCLRADDEETKQTADKLYQDLLNAGVEVIYDDREGIRPGAMFSDADLLGVPIRVVVSPRNLKESCVEITTRDKSVKEMVPVEEAMAFIQNLKNDLYQKIQDKVEPYKE